MTATMERHRAPKSPGRVGQALRKGWVYAVIMFVLLAVWLVGQIQKDAGAAQLEQQSETTRQDLEQVSDPLAQLCATNEAVRAVAGADACQTAARVVQVPGPEGAPGAQGEPGRGIVSTSIDDAGHLLVSYSDGAQIDVGRVAGSDGVMGEPGRGITAANIASGRLVLAFSDGTSQDVGPIVGERGVDGVDGIRGDKGEQGRGIASTEIVDERLVITYTDGTTEDAGPVPAGAQGAEGPAGPPPDSLTLTIDGVEQTCTRDLGSSDMSPTYTCNAASGGDVEQTPPTEPAPEPGTGTGE